MFADASAGSTDTVTLKVTIEIEGDHQIPVTIESEGIQTMNDQLPHE